MSNLTQSQIDKIEIGRTYTSWKQLCEEIGLVYKKSTKSQEYQKLELFRYFDYEKEGRKYTMLTKRELPLLKTSGTRTPYRGILQVLLLDLIANDTNGRLSLTQDNMFLLLSMVNQNFKTYRNAKEQLTLSEELNMKKKTIDIFYDRHSSRFRDMISGALNSLKGQFILTWTKEDRIANKDYTTRKMSDDEKEILLTCKSDIAQYLGKETIKDIYTSGLYEKFMNKTVLEFNARTNSNVKFFYTTYDIIYNKDMDYVEKKRRLLHDRLDKEDKLRLQNELNSHIVNGILDNASQRTSNLWFVENESVLTDRLIKK